MGNARTWHLAQQTRSLTARQGQARGLWADERSRHIHARYLRPHEQHAEGQLDELRRHEAHLDQVESAAREAKLFYEESRLAGQQVVAELSNAEYAVSMTHDSVRRALTFENRAAELQNQAVAAAQAANVVCDGCAGERGQTRAHVTYAPLARRSAAGGGGASRLPAYAGGKTSGILDTGSSRLDLLSGRQGPSAATKGVPGMNGNIKSHVEAHAAAVMRRDRLTEGTLHINRIPCAGVRGCDAMLPRMLPEGARLHVLGPGGFSRTYTGVAD